MEIAGIPLRELIIGACLLAAVYVVVTLLRLLKLRRPAKPAAEEATAPTLPPVMADDADGDAAEDADGDAAEDADEDADLVYSRPVVSAPPPPEPPSVLSFDAELGRSQLEREVRQLREELATVREELAALKAASRVSPQYADAMALAQRGLTAQDVADRCSISLAEAELVWALAHGPQDFEQEDEYGEPGRNPARPE